jgi:hypothetical protein
MTMDAGHDDRNFELPPGAAALIRTRVADGHSGLRRLLIAALGHRQSSSGLDCAGLARLIDRGARSPGAARLLVLRPPSPFWNRAAETAEIRLALESWWGVRLRG